MQKIISLYQRNYDTDRLVRDEVVPGAEWVLAGEGVATRKFDGTCCMIRDGKLFKRYDAKAGKVPPTDFEPAQPAPDPNTGHWPGWLPVGDSPDDRWHREAWDNCFLRLDGTYELIGPKIQGNPEGAKLHGLVRHGVDRLLPQPRRTFEHLKAYLALGLVEGIVWHYTDGRMVKLKAKDFGFSRLPPETY